MEYQSNHNCNSASTASNGPTNSIASYTASGSENRKPPTAQQLVRENVQFLIQQLAAGKSEALTAFLDAMVHFPNYSFGNVLAIARQRPSATRVAGMYTWNQLGRFINKGEKGIAILAPVISRRQAQNTDAEDASNRALLGFRKVPPSATWLVPDVPGVLMHLSVLKRAPIFPHQLIEVRGHTKQQRIELQSSGTFPRQILKLHGRITDCLIMRCPPSAPLYSDQLASVSSQPG